MQIKNKNTGFTIVELLIVIVVIAILAAITIVAYNGIQDRARNSAAAQSSSQAAKKIKVWQVDNEATSPDCPKFYELVTGTTIGAPAIPTPPAVCSFSYKDTGYQYTPSTTVAGGYCVTTTVVTRSYKVSESSAPMSGGCGGHGQGGVATITNLIPNPSIETSASLAGAGAGAAVSRDTTQAYVGAASLKMIGDGSIAGQGSQHLTNISTYAAGIYKASVYVKGTAGVQVYGVLRATGSGLPDVTGSAITLNGTWQRIELAPMSVTNSLTTQFSVMVRTNTAIATTFWTDAAMLTVGSVLYNYADGSSDDWAWNGTINNATSTGPPL